MLGSRGSIQIEGFNIPVGGDIVLSIDGRPVFSFDDLLAEIVARRPGDTVDLLVLRNGESIEIPVLLEERP